MDDAISLAGRKAVSVFLVAYTGPISFMYLLFCVFDHFGHHWLTAFIFLAGLVLSAYIFVRSCREIALIQRTEELGFGRL